MDERKFPAPRHVGVYPTHTRTGKTRTLKVTSEKSRRAMMAFIVIDEADFDPAIHTLYVEKNPPAAA